MASSTYTFTNTKKASVAFQDPAFLPELLSVIDSLPPNQQEILKMRFIHLKSSKEIASFLNCSVSSVNSKMRQGLVQLRKQFHPGYYQLARTILYGMQ